ncbi:MAG: hypothetical protein HY652_00975 [Acidobacteria bacterium]|nr:hypothetical protein [Acidobacteriota bacterium]
MNGIWKGIVIAAALSPVFGWEGASKEGEKATSVTVGDAMAPPEWEVRVSVSQTSAEGTEVGQLSVKISYPAKSLSYVRVEKADLLKDTGAEVSVEAPPAPADAEKATLRLEVTTSKEKPKALPPGLLVYLVFKIAATTEPGPLTLTSEEVQVGSLSSPAEKVEVAAAKPATVTVVPAGLPAIGCFFYMH